jgi:FkbM family methyltransferase
MRVGLIAPIRWLGARRMVLPVTARVLCARTVRESARFLAREVSRPSGIRLYRLRENGVRVAIRHKGVDAATLAEMFYHRYYHPPEEVARAIGEGSEILDLGANVGLFGAFAIARWPHSRIVAFEPDPANARVHEDTIGANGLGGRWRLERAAAATRDGQVQFAAGLNAGSHIVDSQSDEGTVTVLSRDVLPLIAVADLVKMDIEGGEWAILLDARFASHPPRALVLEYHPRGCPDGDPRAAAARVLRASGLKTASIWHASDGHGMLWAWRADTAPKQGR